MAYTFHTVGGACFLKDNIGCTKVEQGAVSGTNGRPPPPPPAPPGWPEACTGANASSFKFCDTSLSLDERLNDLVGRITLAQAGGELTARESDALSNLELPAYYWGTNAIHGIQNTNCLPNGQCPTSFPAPNALSAAFNTSLVQDMGRVIARELRAYYNARFHNSLDTWRYTTSSFTIFLSRLFLSFWFYMPAYLNGIVQRPFMNS